MDHLHQLAQCILFSVVFTPSPPSHWVLTVIFLLLTNAVSPVQACLMSIHMIGEVSWNPKKDDRGGPLSDQGVTKRCLSLLTNSAPSYCIRVPMRGDRGLRGTAVNITWHGAQINFGDLTPYLTYDSDLQHHWP
jgi:hypothetical protein